ncbi:MAG: flagellar motor switch phosphatase FliY [Selenomonadales bacterium]|nr:flagellar motor switch phosphatase FliY [Selenomonadales bacterium]
MTSKYLSQDEIDAILKFGANPNTDLSPAERDALGEVGNISMGTAATTLSQLLNRRVSITTPRVRVLGLQELLAQFSVPYLALLVNFTAGMSGFNLLVVRTSDAAVIADLMLGGTGHVDSVELDELKISAVAEVMNQMIGTAATSLHSLFGRRVNISPPEVVMFDVPPKEGVLAQLERETLAVVAFRMVVGDLIDSELLQVMPVASAKQMAEHLLGGIAPAPGKESANLPTEAMPPAPPAPEVSVQRAQFSPLQAPLHTGPGPNIELILDVPLQVSVVLGKSRKAIKDVLALGTGSVVELDRMVEDQVDVLVNGTLIARGEIVVVNENFGVRITSILSPAERLREINR